VTDVSLEVQPEPPLPFLDHLAVAVETWAEGFPQLAGHFGGQWGHGGDVGEFAPGQLVYRGGMRLELISPGSAGGGFMRRFLDRSGPGPHHLTFRVASLEDALEHVGELGIPALPGRLIMPFRQEAFLHPKSAGLGTLLQFVESDESRLPRRAVATPPSYPAVTPPPARIAWVGLTASALPAAQRLLEQALGGELTDKGDGWGLFSWSAGRRLLVREASATPGGAELWPTRTGVAHVVFGPAELRPTDGGLRPNAVDPRVGLATWTSD
jgi:methylmalonyl-CoA/ethylmalonyl-CoA epimerase